MTPDVSDVDITPREFRALADVLHLYDFVQWDSFKYLKVYGLTFYGFFRPCPFFARIEAEDVAGGLWDMTVDVWVDHRVPRFYMTRVVESNYSINLTMRRSDRFASTLWGVKDKILSLAIPKGEVR